MQDRSALGRALEDGARPAPALPLGPGSDPGDDPPLPGRGGLRTRPCHRHGGPRPPSARRWPTCCSTWPGNWSWARSGASSRPGTWPPTSSARCAGATRTSSTSGRGSAGSPSSAARASSAGYSKGLPPALPSLHLAYRLQERAASVGFDWPDTDGPAAKVREELAETLQALHEAAAVPAAARAGGDRRTGVPTSHRGRHRGARRPALRGGEPGAEGAGRPATALDLANRKFRARFEGVERLAQARGIDVTTAGLAVLDGLWDEVKAGR